MELELKKNILNAFLNPSSGYMAKVLIRELGLAWPSARKLLSVIVEPLESRVIWGKVQNLFSLFQQDRIIKN